MHNDITVGTLVRMGDAAHYIRQILPHGFESFQLNCWQHIGDINLAETARSVRDVVAGRAVVSSVGVFGNPLQDEQCATDFGRMIDAANDFGCNLVVGFAGAIEGKPVSDSIDAFKKVWTPLQKRAKDRGVRIAFENCDMGGGWHDARWNIAHAPTAWDLMFNAIESDNVGLCWEPCHQMVSLIDPLPQLRELLQRGKVFHVHGKDATIDWTTLRRFGLRSGKQYVWHRTPGFGDTNWTDLISILRQHQFKGSIDIEGWHDPVYRDALEMTGQVHGLNYLKHCRGGLFIPNPT
jgi:sugar phosphate isomerase/epimerase